ncbi:MAG: T9SS type A sorting domain-containing protein [Bacteroidota bacterium]
MKKLVLILSMFVGFAVNSFAQIAIYKSGESTDLSGSTLYVTAPSYDQFDVLLEVVNNSGSTKAYRVTRQRLTIPVGWTDGMCWGHCTDVLGGTCWSASQMGNDKWTTQAVSAFDILDGECGNLKPQINPDDFVSGTASYRYYLSTDGYTYLDSVDIVVDFTASLTKPAKTDVTINVQPNPASDFVTIALNGTDSGTLKIVDVLGNVIVKENISGTKKIDLSDFKNGVYFIMIEVNGKTYNRKLIVKH